MLFGTDEFEKETMMDLFSSKVETIIQQIPKSTPWKQALVAF
jgi:hypothetical protein